jgi:alkylation response protein AidB-like acyl-CoA dehydrogenase
MFDLTEEQQQVVEMVRKVATKEIAPLAKELDEQAAFPEHARNVFAELGLLNPLLPAAFDGPEMGVLTTTLIMEEISRVCAATALLLIAQSDGMLPILHGGSPELKKRFLGRLGGGSTVLTALAATEPTAGSDLLGMKTRAVRKGDEYVVNGQKCFITNGAVADVISLYAYTDPDKGAKGISAFVVEKGTPGLSYGRNEVKMGMRGSVNSELFFEDLRIPVANRIGEEGTGFANLMATLTMNRIFCAAQAVGIAQGALDEAVHHARERVQFGKAISHIAVVQSMIADMAAAVESSRLLTRKAAALFDQGDAKQGALFGSLAKTFASDNAMKVTTDAVQVLGGYGYMKDHGVERMMRDAKLTQIYTGTNQITRIVAGRALLLS